MRVLASLSGVCLILNALAAQAGDSGSNELRLKPVAEHSLLTGATVSVLLAFFLVGVACIGLMWWRKRMIPGQTNGDVYIPLIRNSQRLTQKTMLITIVWQGKVYLLAESQGTVSVLDSTPVEKIEP